MILRLLRTEPAIVRGLLVAITAIAAAILGREIDTEWVDTTVTIYAMVSGLIASILIRRAVRPARAVDPTPGTYVVNIASDLSPEQAADAVDKVVRRTQQHGLYRREGA